MQQLSGTVLVTGDSVDARFLDKLTGAGLEIRNPPSSFPPEVMSSESLTDALSGCVAYLVGGDEFASKEVLAAATSLRIVAFLGVGYTSFVDAEAAAQLGIPVTITPGTLANSVAEFTIGHLLNERRRIAAYADSFKSGADLPQVKRRDLADHPIGIVGLGGVGTRIAEILTQGFHCNVSYFSRTRKQMEEARLGIAYKPLSDLVREVEVLILMVPETLETEGMINEPLLRSRPEGSEPLIIINTARAEIIEPDAARIGLESGIVESIAFDGYYKTATAATEQLKQHERVTITPHIASLTHDARDAMAEMCTDSILGVLRGERVPHIVNFPQDQ